MSVLLLLFLLVVTGIYLLVTEPEVSRRCMSRLVPRSFRVGRRRAVLGAFTLVPLYVMVTASLKPLGDVQGDVPLVAHAPHLPAVHRHLETVPLARYFVNS